MIDEYAVVLTANASGSASVTTGIIRGIVKGVKIDHSSSASSGCLVSITTTIIPTENIFSAGSSGADISVVPMRAGVTNANVALSAADNRWVEYVISEPLSITMLGNTSGQYATIRIIVDGAVF